MPSLPIPLTPRYSLLVKEGDAIHIGQPLAKRSPVKEEVVNIAQELGIPVKKVAKALKKNPGDRVAPGDTLAVAIKRMGFSQESVESRVSGRISRFERESGEIVISEGEDETLSPEEIVSPIEGKVAVCNNETIVLSTDKNVLIAEQASGTTAQAELLEISGEKDESVAVHQINASVVGKVLLVKDLQKDIVVKAISIGAVGVIGFHLLEEDANYLATKHPMIPVLQVGEAEYKKLSAWKGKKVFLDGNSKAILLLS